MIKTLKLIGCGVLLVLMITGCSDLKSVQDGIIANNQRVTMVLDSYEAGRTNGRSIESIVFKSLASGDPSALSGNKVVSGSKGLQTTLTGAITGLHKRITDYVESNNLAFDDQSSSGKGTSLKKITDLNNFVSSVTTTHYFVDDSTGRVEQIFIVQLPNGFIGGVSIFWVGGVYADVKTFGRY